MMQNKFKLNAKLKKGKELNILNQKILKTLFQLVRISLMKQITFVLVQAQIQIIKTS